jgi:hypothetical protein
VDEDRGWAYGQNSVLIYTSDGGITWEALSTIPGTIYSMFFYSETEGWIGGNMGNMWHTTDGGQSWNLQETGTFEGFFAVYFINSNVGWAAGSGGITMKTINGGENWELVYSNTIAFLYSLSFADENNGWIAGRFGTILHTENGGASWSIQNSNVGVDLSEIVMVNENEGWVVGDEGVILHTTTGGTMGIELQSWDSSNSDHVTLYPNFPNPFYDFTTIRFTIPVNSGSNQHIKLGVYGLDGTMINDLLDNFLNEGTYELKWNGRNQANKPLNPGTYILKLDCGHKTVAKKISLLK